LGTCFATCFSASFGGSDATCVWVSAVGTSITHSAKLRREPT
jgi:hypothetical protein